MLSRTSTAFSSPGLTTCYLSRVIVSLAMVAALALSLPSAASAHVNTESAAGGESRPGPVASQVSRTVVASGLNNPRHMTIGSDGTIYVAESGTGGLGPCLEGPEGEQCFGSSGSVTAITDSGQERIAESLPSLAEEGGFAALGPSDVAIAADGTVRALLGLGHDPAVRTEVLDPAASALLGQVVNIQPDGSAVAVLDVAAFEASDNPDGGEIDSNPTALIPTDSGYLIVDAGANALYSFDGTTLSTVAVFPDVLVPAPPFIPVPEIPMQAVPTSVAVGPDGAYYVGQLTGFPFPPGMAQVFRVDPDSGDVTVYADGFTNIIDIEFAPDGTLYVLQISSSGILAGEFDGALHKVGSDGASEVVEEDLFAPGGLAISTEGDVYVSTCGICPGAGEVLLLNDGAPDFDVAYTTSSDRSAAAPLAGAEISGPAYVFVSPLAPSADIRRVEFVLDDAPFRTEFLAPYDFMARAAGPWDSSSVADGPHTITAVAFLADGSTAVSSATFTTANGVAPVDSGLGYSNDRQRSDTVDLNGAVVQGTIWAYVFPIFPPGHESVENVSFTLDGEAFRTEFLAPYDFAGSGPGWDTTTVPDGEHTIVATATISGAPTMMATATFTVANDGPVPPPPPPVDPEAPGIIALPNGFQPEGVAIGQGTDLFVGSLGRLGDDGLSVTGGAIYKADVSTGEGEVLVESEPGKVAVGLTVDTRTNYLWVAGGPFGTANVYDGATGDSVVDIVLADLAPFEALVNDVVIGDDAAYFTDSFRPVLYRVPLGADGEIPDPVVVEEIALSGDFAFTPGGINANGIVAPAGSGALIVGHLDLGALYWVDISTGEATLIDLAGATLTGIDGLVLDGSTVYAVQNSVNQISAVELSADYTSGEVSGVITSPDFRGPTTADQLGDHLYAVNARFDVAPPPFPGSPQADANLEFEVVRVSKSDAVAPTPPPPPPAENIVAGIAKAPIVPDGDVAGADTDFVITLDRSLDPAVDGRSLAAGNTIRITLPDDFVDNGFDTASPGTPRCAPGPCNVGVLLQGWPQHPIAPPAAKYTLETEGTHTFVFTALEDLGPAGAGEPGIKQSHLVLLGFTNPAPGDYEIVVEAQTGEGGAVETGTGTLTIRPEIAPSVNITSAFNDGTPNTIYQSTAVGQPTPLAYDFLLFDGTGGAMTGVTLENGDLMRDGARVGQVSISAPDGATGQSVGVAEPSSEVMAPVLGKPAGRLTATFTAGSAEGDYEVTFSLDGGTSVTMFVEAVAAPPETGFLTDEDPFITLDAGLPSDATVKALISSGETLGDFTFEGLPDGIGIRPGPDPDTVEVYVAHEQTTVPFFGSRDFQGASVSRLTLSTIVGQNQGAILDAEVALSPDAGFLRFCSASMAGPDEGLEDYVFFTGEETNDTVDGTQRGFAVALNTRTGEHVAVPGMGRLNHESVVVVPGGWDDLAMLTTDDTFSAPSSQLYMYLAEDQDAIFADTGSLYALRITGVDGTPLADATDPQNGANDYLDLDVGEEFQAEFIPVPRDVAVGDQTALEDWSNANNVYQSIRLEDAAVDKSDGRVVYIADTGASRVLPDPATGQMMRGPSGTVGSADNGRIFKMVMNADDPTIVDSLSILADGDAVGTDVYVPFTSPDNIDTSTQSLMVQEDTDGAQIWQLSFGDNSWRSVATINDPDGESSGIVDASAWFGSGSWLLDVQGHGMNVEEETVEEILIKRESGQLMLLSIPGS